MGNHFHKEDEDYMKDRYSLGKGVCVLIYSGPNSQVFKSFDKENKNKEVAIKIINKTIIKQITKDAESEKKYIKSIENEPDLLSMCKSPYTLKVYDCFETKENFYIIMEYYEMNLHQYLYNNKKENGLSVKEIQDIFNKLNVAFMKMDKEDIVHRDLKPENILIKTGENGEVIPILCDFGIGRETRRGMCSTLLIGTLGYMAPEVMEDGDNGKGKYYGKSADLWSIGVLLYELCKMSLPYEGLSRVALKKAIKRGDKYETIEDKDLADLIAKLLQPEPEQRMNYRDYFNHPFWTKEFN